MITWKSNRATAAWTVLASVLALVPGCKAKEEQKLQLGYRQESTSESAPTTASQPVQVAREQVPVAPVEVAEENNSVRLTGTLAADEEAQVASRAGGIVREIRVDRGSVVQKGDVLAVIDPIDARNAYAEGLAGVQELSVRLGLKSADEKFDPANQPEVASAKAALELAEANFKRNRELFEKKVISTAEFDRARNEFESARQRYQQAWQQAGQLYQSYRTALVRLKTLHQAVEDTTVKAPFDGLVAEKLVSPGETVTGAGRGGSSGAPGGKSSVVSLVRIDPLRLLVTVPAREVSLIRPGQTVNFQVDAFPDRTFTGTVTRVSPSLETESRSLTVEARVPNPDETLRPGMFASARLQLPQQEQVLYVPSGAVRRQGEVARVFVVEDGVAREKVVTVNGDAINGRIRVLTGLDPGDIVVADAARASDGMRVQ